VGLVFVFLLVCGLFIEVSVLAATLPLPEANTWVEMPSMQQARYDLSVTVVDGNIYAIGGRNDELVAVGIVEMYDPEVNNWTYRASLQQARYNLGVVVVEGKIYAIGGEVRVSGSAKSYAVDTVEVYDPVTDNWTYKNSMPTSGSTSNAPLPASSSTFVVTVLGNKIYCLSPEFNLVYDPVSDVWENKHTLPIAADFMYANVVSGKIICLISGNSVISYLTMVYDPLTDNWTQKASLPDGFSAGPTVYDDKLYMIGAQTEPKYNGLPIIGKVMPMVQVYEPEKDTWSVVASGGPGLCYRLFSMSTSGVYAPSMLYCLCGSASFDIYEFMGFDLASSVWVSAAELPTPRTDVSVVVLNDLVYVLGGYTVSGFKYMRGIPISPILTASALVERYTPFGWGEVAPVVSIVSLEDGVEYGPGDVPLEFSLARPMVWMGYSLDGQANITITGNVTLSGLSSGQHSVRVFAEDAYGNVGVSDAVTFSVASAPFPLLPVVAVVVLGVVAVCVGLFLFLRKRRRIKFLTMG